MFNNKRTERLEFITGLLKHDVLEAHKKIMELQTELVLAKAKPKLKLNAKQKKTLTNFIVSEPNTQTDMAIIAKAVLDLSA